MQTKRKVEEATRKRILVKLNKALKSAQQENMNLPRFWAGLSEAINIIRIMPLGG